MKTTFIKNYGTMSIETEIRSIFDRNCAGQIDVNGDYYCIHTDHKTHEKYALLREDEYKTNSLGKKLEENENAEFHGEKVRGMTLEEEIMWNEDRLTALVDLWGNIAIDEKANVEYAKQYYENYF